MKRSLVWLSISLMLFCSEPAPEKSLLFVVVFYSVLLSNLYLSIRYANKKCHEKGIFGKR